MRRYLQKTMTLQQFEALQNVIVQAVADSEDYQDLRQPARTMARNGRRRRAPKPSAGASLRIVSRARAAGRG